MPATIGKPKPLFPRTPFVTEAKSPGLRGRILEALKKSKGGMTIEQIAKAVGTKSRSPEPQEIRVQIAKIEEELKALSVAELPSVILPELHDAASGRIDAQKVAEFMGVPLKQLSDGLGLNYKAVHRNPSAAGNQQALRPVKRSMELLHEFFGAPETIRIWLNTPHPDLDGTSALRTILEGKPEAVALILENAWNGLPV